MPFNLVVVLLACVAIRVNAFSGLDYNKQIKDLYPERLANDEAEYSTIIAPSPSPSLSSVQQSINVSAIPANLLPRFVSTTHTTQNQSNYAQSYKPATSSENSKDESSSHARGVALHEGDVGYDGTMNGSYSMSGSDSGSEVGQRHTIHVESTAAPSLVGSVATPILVTVMLLAVWIP